ncbi:MAG: hypothetical protein WKG07_09640 [Hymenobacter sp.]
MLPAGAGHRLGGRCAPAHLQPAARRGGAAPRRPAHQRQAVSPTTQWTRCQRREAAAALEAAGPAPGGHARCAVCFYQSAFYGQPA